MHYNDHLHKPHFEKFCEATLDVFDGARVVKIEPDATITVEVLDTTYYLHCGPTPTDAMVGYNGDDFRACKALALLTAYRLFLLECAEPAKPTLSDKQAAFDDVVLSHFNKVWGIKYNPDSTVAVNIQGTTYTVSEDGVTADKGYSSRMEAEFLRGAYMLYRTTLREGQS